MGCVSHHSLILDPQSQSRPVLQLCEEDSVYRFSHYEESWTHNKEDFQKFLIEKIEAALTEHQWPHRRPFQAEIQAWLWSDDGASQPRLKISVLNSELPFLLILPIKKELPKCSAEIHLLGSSFLPLSTGWWLTQVTVQIKAGSEAQAQRILFQNGARQVQLMGGSSFLVLVEPWTETRFLRTLRQHSEYPKFFTSASLSPVLELSSSGELAFRFSHLIR